jgi:hypothetical protein
MFIRRILEKRESRKAGRKRAGDEEKRAAEK